MEAGLIMHSAKIETTQFNPEYNAWNQTLELLKLEYGDAVFRSWFLHLKFEEIKDGIMVITVPTKFIREWVMSNYITTIKETLLKIDPTVRRIEVKVRMHRNRLAHAKPSNDDILPEFKSEDRCNIFDFTLDSRLTFENFVVGTSNKIAASVAKAIADNKRTIDNNILYVQSSVGMGKTHLLQAIASHIKITNPTRKVAFLSAEKFMHLFIRSIRDNDSITFKEKLRTADILIIDDLQFICGKNSTEQELLNTVTALTESNKKVVLSCDTSPYNLNLDIRAKSRLAGGLVVNIAAPDYNLRLEILQSKIKRLGANISDEILALIASNITSSVRELEGAVSKLVSHCNITNKIMSLEVAEEILRDNIAAHSQQIGMDSVLHYVAEFYGVKVIDIQSKKRSARFVLPRQIAAFVAKQVTQYSLQEIGYKLGNKDHATVIYSIKKIEEKMSYDQALTHNISKIIASLGK